MNRTPDTPLPLGNFLPADIWQNRVNSIFYGTLGSGIHDHFQTYVSRDYRLAYALADEFFEGANKLESSRPIFIQEWGVGNGNLAACFLDRLRIIDSENLVYPRLRYILCDYSLKILRGARTHPRLKEHEGHYFTIQVDAENLNCFKPNSVHKIISNEIWDDLASKVLVKDDGLFLEEFLQPMLNPREVGGNFESLAKAFEEKDLIRLGEFPPFLDKIVWQRAYQRVDLSDWPFSKIIENHLERLPEKIPAPINTGAFSALGTAFILLAKNSLGYSGMDYGMLDESDLADTDRPYYNLYGGQYTFMVNFPLLAETRKAIGFNSIHLQRQHHFVGERMRQDVLSLLELVQSHPEASHMEIWERDILLLETLHVINIVYKSPFKHKLEYPTMPGAPKKFRKKIEQLVKTLNPWGVPDTVAYLTRDELVASSHRLHKLGYREKHLQIAFKACKKPVSFIYSRFNK